jgi:hypothetical protein
VLNRRQVAGDERVYVYLIDPALRVFEFRTLGCPQVRLKQHPSDALGVRVLNNFPRGTQIAGAFQITSRKCHRNASDHQ